MKLPVVKFITVPLVVSVLLSSLTLSACLPGTKEMPQRLPGPYVSGKEALETINTLRTEALKLNAPFDSYWQADTLQKLLSINPEGWGLYALGIWYNSKTKESLRIHEDGTIRYVGANGHIKVLWFNSETQKVHDLADLRLDEGKEKEEAYKEEAYEEEEPKPELVKGLDRLIICGEIMGGGATEATGGEAQKGFELPSHKEEPRKPGEQAEEDINSVMQMMLDLMETVYEVAHSDEWWATESFPSELPGTPTDRAEQLDSWLRSVTDPTRKEPRLLPVFGMRAEDEAAEDAIRGAFEEDGATVLTCEVEQSDEGYYVHVSWVREGEEDKINGLYMWGTETERGKETEYYTQVVITINGEILTSGELTVTTSDSGKSSSWTYRETVCDEPGKNCKTYEASGKSKPRPDRGVPDVPSEEEIRRAWEIFRLLRDPVRILKEGITNPDPTESPKGAYTALTGKLIHVRFGAIDPGREGGKDLPSEGGFLDCIYNMNLKRDPGWVDPVPMFKPTTSREMRALGKAGLFGVAGMEAGAREEDFDGGRGRPGLPEDIEQEPEIPPAETEEPEIPPADTEGPTFTSMVDIPDPIYTRGNNPDQTNVMTSISDPSGISRVTLWYRYQGSSSWTELPMTYRVANDYSARLGPFDYAGVIEYRVGAWDMQGNVSESSIGTVTVIAPQFRLAIQLNGSGSTSPSQGTYYYDCGTVVNISAQPASGWEFVNWSGDVANTSSPNTTVTMDSDKTITANFRAIPDTEGPSITNVSDFPDPIYTSGTKPDQATVSATVTDPSGVSTVFLEQKYKGDIFWASQQMTSEGGNVYTATIGPLSKTGLIQYRIRAVDSLNNVSTSKTGTITVTMP